MVIDVVDSIYLDPGFWFLLVLLILFIVEITYIVTRMIWFPMTEREKNVPWHLK